MSLTMVNHGHHLGLQDWPNGSTWIQMVKLDVIELSICLPCKLAVGSDPLVYNPYFFYRNIVRNQKDG